MVSLLDRQGRIMLPRQALGCYLCFAVVILCDLIVFYFIVRLKERAKKQAELYLYIVDFLWWVTG